MTFRSKLNVSIYCLLIFEFIYLNPAYAQTTTIRSRENFDSGWLFFKGDIPIKRAIKAGKYGGLTDINAKMTGGEETVIAYTDKDQAIGFKASDWKQVDIPHDWCVEGTFVHDDKLGSRPGSNGYLPTGIGCYRKEFEIPETEKGKKISIEFDGVFRNSTVWVNGHLLGNHPSGYTPVNYDLTDVLRYGNEGKNIIFVKVDASEPEGWWYEGCGIYRHVWMIKTDRLHVSRFGTFVTTPQVSTAEATVNIKTRIINEDKTSKTFTLVSKVLDLKGNVIDTQTSIQSAAPLQEIEISHDARVISPALWSPETPHLYEVLSEVSVNGNLTDNYKTTFGIRTLDFNENGFLLNGKPYPIKGTCNHQDFAGIGVALPDKINEYKIKLLKEMGSNAYRCSHNPPTPELLDICDRLGMLVMDENRLLSTSPDGIADLKEMLYRDRNHPSVFMWSLENEETLEGTVIGARILESMVQITHNIDPTRLTTAAMNHGWNEGSYSDKVDIVGYNYGQRKDQYTKDHEKYPQRRMICSETTSFTTTRGEYEDNTEKGYVSNYGTKVPSWSQPAGKDWDDIVKYPYLTGMFAWTGFDYRGEPTPYAWPCVTSHFGIMDICGFPKDGYYAYKAAWGNEPVVHIFPHWNWPGKEGQTIKVQGYSNCHEVELFVNGKSAGKKALIPFTKFEWDVTYKPGKMVAKGYKNNKVVSEKIIETTSAPSQIDLQSDCASLKADGCDIAVIRVAIKDSKGRIVPTSDNLVKFSVEGPGKIIGTGNGNPSSHEPDKANQRMAFNGYCLVLVQSLKAAGEIKLKATSGGLKNTELVIKVN